MFTTPCCRRHITTFGQTCNCGHSWTQQRAAQHSLIQHQLMQEEIIEEELEEIEIIEAVDVAFGVADDLFGF